tara:strand:- start:695 stop:1237 length:543 start_codon:yes stop_codon:yes gene_type:complete
MVSTKKRLEQLENAILVLAGGGAGFAAGRMGTVEAAKAAARSPVARQALAAASYAALRAELNRRDQEMFMAETGRDLPIGLELQQALSPAPLPVGTVTAAGQKIGKAARRKVKSKFNKAVSAGMKAAKASTSYGKKGTINNAKKAFTAVTKEASRISKGAKVAKSGIKRKIGLAIKKVLK